jgi:hypothetical protein
MQLYDNNNRISEIQIEANNTIEAMINHFIDLITNRGIPINSSLIGAITVYILEKIKEGIEKNSRVEVIMP